jgi:Protein kinase domain
VVLRRRERASARSIEVVPGYANLVEIGGGAFATVYRATEIDTGRNVALKVLKLETVQPHLVETFNQEIQALGKVSDHPNIVTLYRPLSTPDGRPALVMELCRESLAQQIRRTGHLDTRHTVRVGIKMAGALETAHRNGFLHRDMKPQNILVTQFDEPALADFGVAALQASAQATAGVLGFTTVHAAPEILEGHELSPATDIYGLASTMHQLLTGMAPFAAFENEAPAAVILRILRDSPRPIRSNTVPLELSDLLEASLAKDPEGRPATAARFAEALREIEEASLWPQTSYVAWGAGPARPAPYRIPAAAAVRATPDRPPAAAVRPVPISAEPPPPPPPPPPAAPVRPPAASAGSAGPPAPAAPLRPAAPPVPPPPAVPPAPAAPLPPAAPPPPAGPASPVFSVPPVPPAASAQPAGPPAPPSVHPMPEPTTPIAALRLNKAARPEPVPPPPSPAEPLSAGLSPPPPAPPPGPGLLRPDPGSRRVVTPGGTTRGQPSRPPKEGPGRLPPLTHPPQSESGSARTNETDSRPVFVDPDRDSADGSPGDGSGTGATESVYEATILPPSGRRVSERKPIEPPSSHRWLAALMEWPPLALAGLATAVLVVIVALLLIVGVL